MDYSGLEAVVGLVSPRSSRVRSAHSGREAVVGLVSPRSSSIRSAKLSVALASLALLLTDCRVVGGIFKAGIWVGVIAVIAVVAIIGGVAGLFRK